MILSSRCDVKQQRPAHKFFARRIRERGYLDPVPGSLFDDRPGRRWQVALLSAVQAN